MNKPVKLLTPIGRIVQGSVYKGSTTDIDGRPLTFKTGEQAGQPRTNFWFYLAIQKNSEVHWNLTEWGKLIWEAGNTFHPNGVALRPDYSWKIIDGDSMLPNREGKRPCDNEYYPGHWILKFNTSFAISLFNKDGTMALTEPNAIQPGDYIQVYGQIAENDSNQNPGIILNPVMIALNAIGERIILGIDASEVGFGNASLPQGAKLAENNTPFAPNNTYIPPVSNVAPMPNPSPTPVPAPYTQILNPPSTPQHRLTEKAQGFTYEQLIANGWTDRMLIQEGLMTV